MVEGNRLREYSKPPSFLWAVHCKEVNMENSGLREWVLAQYDEVSTEAAFSSRSEGLQVVGGKWYVPKWGCDTLEHTLDALLSRLGVKP
jgi:hypothetical protein